MRTGVDHFLVPWCILATFGYSTPVMVAEDTRNPDFPPEKRTLLDKFVNDLIVCRKLPGLTLSLVRGDRNLFARGYGLKELTKLEPVTNETIFCIGSLTKGFTATILAMLVGENDSLTWDTPVQEILGKDFQLCDEHRSKYVNIRDLLAHKTGIPGYFGALTTGIDAKTEDIVRRLRYLKPYKKFHSAYMYNNYMYILAGYIAEILTGQSWKELVQQRIFKPLAMASSVFADDVLDWRKFALPYVSINDELIPLNTTLLKSLGPAGPSGTICSNSIDMQKWLQFQLNGGLDMRGHRLVSQKEFQELHTPQIPTPMPLGRKLLKQPAFPISEGRFAYDLGWSSGIYRGFHNVQHNGRIFGYDSLIWLFPDNNVAIFSSVNGPMNAHSKNALRVIHHYAADLLLGQEAWLNQSSSCTFPDPWLHNYNKTKHRKTSGRVMVAQKSSSLEKNGAEAFHRRWRSKQHKKKNRFPDLQRYQRPLSEYVGIYGHPAFGNITIYLNSSTQQLYLAHGKFGQGILLPTNKIDKFHMRFQGLLRYMSEADGWDMEFPIIFQSAKDDSSKIDFLYAHFIEKTVPPLFQRGASWQDFVPSPSYPNAKFCPNNLSRLIPACSVISIVLSLLPVLIIFF
ncbi:uncharacterized protein LOC106868112 [Octopus bimaculoides]|uniref:Beta-lactamase-related domain-containing protein n=1 Tax=Octopus bimaculoides TaxID=37653 RepID=A0A0L8HWU1_OCTBM|nr:uncharacterized protein LOC106868112 [Octopus bimaculoides]|eukprot:XP_014768721.1 PREDICTED: uncharacterized protein LOC106868112 [Octopus bimaculoides]